MKEYIFECPQCKGNMLMEISRDVVAYAHIRILDYGDGPDVNEMDCEYEINGKQVWECYDCGWKLPCNNHGDVINFVMECSKDDEE